MIIIKHMTTLKPLTQQIRKMNMKTPVAGTRDLILVRFYYDLIIPEYG